MTDYKTFAQKVQAMRDQVAGGLVAGDHQQLEEAVELALAQLVAIDLGIDHQAPHVVGRPGPLFQRLG